MTRGTFRWWANCGTCGPGDGFEDPTSPIGRALWRSSCIWACASMGLHCMVVGGGGVHAVKGVWCHGWLGNVS